MEDRIDNEASERIKFTQELPEHFRALAEALGVEVCSMRAKRVSQGQPLQTTGKKSNVFSFFVSWVLGGSGGSRMLVNTVRIDVDTSWTQKMHSLIVSEFLCTRIARGYFDCVPGLLRIHFLFGFDPN